MTRKYDVVVIGTGISGTTASFECASAGKKVAVVDEREFGGTCPLRGCDPKKVLVGAAEVIHRFQGIQGQGLLGNPEIDWKDLVGFKRTFTQHYPEELEKSMTGAGMELFHGKAEFTGKNSLRINGEEIAFENCLIATGAKPRPLGIPGEELVTTSEEFMEKESLPERILFIGGGYISFEFAHLAARAGSRPLILHRSDRVLKVFDPDLVEILEAASRDAGIEIEFNQTVSSVKNVSGALQAETEDGKIFSGGMVVHGAGRVPEIEKLKPDQAEILSGKRGIQVNSYLQSVSNPAVYAAGDASGTGAPLTSIATVQGEITAQNIISGPKHTFNSLTTPSVVFTLPVLAKVGMLEPEAKNQNQGFEVKFQETSSWYNSRRIGLKHSGFKTIIEKKSGNILGAHILGHHAEDVINLFTLAIQYNLNREQLSRLPYTYPTPGFDIRYMV